MDVGFGRVQFSPRNLQQLLNNLLKDAESVTLTRIGGDQLTMRGPIELGTEAIAFRSGEHEGIIVVPFHAVQRLRVA